MCVVRLAGAPGDSGGSRGADSARAPRLLPLCNHQLHGLIPASAVAARAARNGRRGAARALGSLPHFRRRRRGKSSSHLGVASFQHSYSLVIWQATFFALDMIGDGHDGMLVKVDWISMHCAQGHFFPYRGWPLRSQTT